MGGRSLRILVSSLDATRRKRLRRQLKLQNFTLLYTLSPRGERVRYDHGPEKCFTQTGRPGVRPEEKCNGKMHQTDLRGETPAYGVTYVSDRRTDGPIHGVGGRSWWKSEISFTRTKPFTSVDNCVISHTIALWMVAVGATRNDA